MLLHVEKVMYKINLYTQKFRTHDPVTKYIPQSKATERGREWCTRAPARTG